MIQTNYKYDYRKLIDYCTALFENANVPSSAARAVSESMVQANLRGVDSHGVVRTDIYLRRLEANMINIDGHMDVREDGPITLLNGNNHFGAVVGNKALELTIKGAKEFGTSVVGVKGSNHFGTCAYYLLQAIEHDIILILLSNASQTMPPTGGVRPFIGTNPFSIGVPTGSHVPFILDMATSVVARGKIIVAAQKGESIPVGWALDKYGNPTTDANAALDGAVLPFGQAKGYGISMFIDILCGVLTGAGFGKYVNNMYDNWQQPQNVGHFFIAFDINKFMPIDQFKQRIDLYFDEIKSEPRANGVEEILIPGELEHRTTLERMQTGIELPTSVAKELSQWGARYNLDLTEAIIK